MKIAIIGYGGMGGYHAELLHQFAAEGGALTLAGIYDIDPAARNSPAKTASAPMLPRKRSGRTRRSPPS